MKFYFSAYLAVQLITLGMHVGRWSLINGCVDRGMCHCYTMNYYLEGQMFFFATLCVFNLQPLPRRLCPPAEEARIPRLPLTTHPQSTGSLSDNESLPFHRPFPALYTDAAAP